MLVRHLSYCTREAWEHMGRTKRCVETAKPIQVCIITNCQGERRHLLLALEIPDTSLDSMDANKLK